MTPTQASCEHDGDHNWGGDGLYRCIKCDVPLCTDCGTTPSWWAADRQYCRRCNEKAGHTGESYAEVDMDKLLLFFGGDEGRVRAFLDKAVRD